MGKSSGGTTGFKYFMDLHFLAGLGRGGSKLTSAVKDALLAIVVGDRVAWEGEQTQNGSIQINAPELFGGDEKEGGIVGPVEVMFGGQDQGINGYLQSAQGAPQSAYRGLFGLLLKSGQVATNNPYIKAWSIVRRRITGDWFGGTCWHEAKAPIQLEIGGAPPGTGGGPGVPLELGFNFGQKVTLVPNPGVLSPDVATKELAESFGATYVTTDQAYWFWRANESGLGFIKLHGEGDVEAALALIAKGWAVGETAVVKFDSSALGVVILTVDETAPFAPAGYAWYHTAAFPTDTVLGSVYMWVSGLNIIGENNSAAVGPLKSSRYCMNPAHVIYQCITDPENGMGYPAAVIDDASFTAAADQLYAEGLGVNLRWTQQTTIEDFISIAQDHAGGLVVTDRRTGLFKFKLLRKDYVTADLPVFGPHNCRIVGDAQRPSAADTVNELQVTYTDYRTRKEATTTVRNVANQQAVGRIISKSHSLTGLPTESLAQRCGQRDLDAMSLPLWRFDLSFLRMANVLEPGGVFRFVWPPLNLDIVLRIGNEIDYGTVANGEIRARCVEDVFSLPDSVYTGSVGDPNPEPSTGPLRAASTILEAPYRDLVQALTAEKLASMADDAGYVAAIAVRANQSQTNFELHTRLDPAPFTLAATGDFAGSALLSAPVLPLDAGLPCTSEVDLTRLEIGTAAFLGEGANAEMVRIVSVNPGMIGVARGCGDTVPRAWPQGTRLWGYDNYGAADPAEYVDGETVDAKVYSRSPAGISATAELQTIIPNSRWIRPYPPGQVRSNGGLVYGGSSTIPPPPVGPVIPGGGSPTGQSPTGAPASTGLGPNGGYPDTGMPATPLPTASGADEIGPDGDFGIPGSIGQWKDISGNPLSGQWVEEGGRLKYTGGTGFASASLVKLRQRQPFQPFPRYTLTVTAYVQTDPDMKARIGDGFAYSPLAEYPTETLVTFTRLLGPQDALVIAPNNFVEFDFFPVLSCTNETVASLRAWWRDPKMSVALIPTPTTPGTSIPHMDFDNGLASVKAYPPGDASIYDVRVVNGEFIHKGVADYAVERTYWFEDQLVEADAAGKYIHVMAEVLSDDPTIFLGTTVAGVTLGYVIVEIATGQIQGSFLSAKERGDFTAREAWHRLVLANGTAGYGIYAAWNVRCAPGRTAKIRNFRYEITDDVQD